jgi:hypothetical protein
MKISLPTKIIKINIDAQMLHVSKAPKKDTTICGGNGF